jgi:hypothetical protein
MTNGLNRRFQRDPVSFLSSYWDINSAQPQHGEGYGIDVNGIANLDLSEYSPQTVRVSKADSGIFASLTREEPIKAYYLTSRIDKTMAMPLGKDCDFFFTDAITGCQFMAYGNNRHNITVCHVNALTLGSAFYNNEAAQLRQASYPIEIIHGQSQYQAGLAAVDRPHVVVTVVGWRRADGWHFYERRRVNAPNNRRVLGEGAAEL